MIKLNFIKTIVLAAIIAGVQCESPSLTVIGGHDAEPGTFPFMAALRYISNDTHFCGGAIINIKWIVTAFHCVKTKTANIIGVSVGSAIRKDGQKYNIGKIIGYPHYRNYDLALLKTQSDLDFSKPTVVNKIPFGKIAIAGNVARVYGWGFIQPGGPQSKHLQYLDTTIQAFGCQSGPAYAKSQESYVCTYSGSTSRACSGDSGGPLVFKGQLVGVVSGGDKICTEVKWDAFAKISFFSRWINDQIKAN